MSARESGDKYDERLLTTQRTDFYFALLFAICATTLNTFGLILDTLKPHDIEILTSYTVPLLLVFVEFFLLVATCSLCIKKSKRSLISSFSFVAILTVYLIWYLYSQHVLGFLLSKPFYQQHREALAPHPLGLIGAKWWNLIVLTMVGILLMWEVRGLTRAAISSWKAKTMQ